MPNAAGAAVTTGMFCWGGTMYDVLYAAKALHQHLHLIKRALKADIVYPYHPALLACSLSQTINRSSKQSQTSAGPVGKTELGQVLHLSYCQPARLLLHFCCCLRCDRVCETSKG